MGNWLTPTGKKTLKWSTKKKRNLGIELLQGGNILNYTGGMCFDVAAYIRFLLNPKIKSDYFQKNITTKDSFDFFNFSQGQIWNGQTHIWAGSALGFYRLPTCVFFHVAISVGGNMIRGVNGGDLGIGWSQKINMKTVLGKPNPDGTFNYNKSRIRVYISPI